MAIVAAAIFFKKSQIVEPDSMTSPIDANTPESSISSSPKASLLPWITAETVPALLKTVSALQDTVEECVNPSFTTDGKIRDKTTKRLIKNAEDFLVQELKIPRKELLNRCILLDSPRMLEQDYEIRVIIGGDFERKSANGHSVVIRPNCSLSEESMKTLYDTSWEKLKPQNQSLDYKEFVKSNLGSLYQPRTNKEGVVIGNRIQKRFAWIKNYWPGRITEVSRLKIQVNKDAWPASWKPAESSVQEIKNEDHNQSVQEIKNESHQ